MEPDLGIDLEQLRATLRAHGVRFALVFGSRARGEHDDESDLDLAVMGDGPLDRPWAILPDEADVLDLATAPESIAGRVAVEGVVVLDDDPAARVRWQAQTRKRWADEAFRRARFNEDFVAGRG